MRLDGNKHVFELSNLIQALPKSIKLWEHVAFYIMCESNWKQAFIQMIKPSSIQI
jgi:hypothetical protein